MGKRVTIQRFRFLRVFSLLLAFSNAANALVICDHDPRDPLPALKHAKYVFEAKVAYRGERRILHTKDLNHSKPSRTMNMRTEDIEPEFDVDPSRLKNGHVYLIGTVNEQARTGKDFVISVCDVWFELDGKGQDIKAKFLESLKVERAQ